MIITSSLACAQNRCCVVACADVGRDQVVQMGRSSGSEGSSAASRAVRRGNRRLTRNESRYHSGKLAAQDRKLQENKEMRKTHSRKYNINVIIPKKTWFVFA